MTSAMLGATWNQASFNRVTGTARAQYSSISWIHGAHYASQSSRNATTNNASGVSDASQVAHKLHACW